MQATNQEQVLVPRDLPHGAGTLVSHPTDISSTTSTMQPTPHDISEAAAGLTLTPLTSVIEQKTAGGRPASTAALAPAGHMEMPEAVPTTASDVHKIHTGTMLPPTVAAAGPVSPGGVPAIGHPIQMVLPAATAGRLAPNCFMQHLTSIMAWCLMLQDIECLLVERGICTVWQDDLLQVRTIPVPCCLARHPQVLV